MSTETKRSLFTLSVSGGAAALILMVGTKIGELTAHAQRLDKVEVKCERIVSLETSITRIETKLDLLLEAQRKGLLKP